MCLVEPRGSEPLTSSVPHRSALPAGLRRSLPDEVLRQEQARCADSWQLDSIWFFVVASEAMESRDLGNGNRHDRFGDVSENVTS